MAEETPTHSQHPRAASEQSDSLSHPITINLPPDSHDDRPPPVKHSSAPTASAYHSPSRHHRRTPSRSKGVKETLDARSSYGSGDYDGASVHRINQYIIKQEIGRGSFGAVHLATDQYGHEYAVKEFSKSRLRKRAQSNLLRNPNGGRRPGHLAAGLGFNSPLHRIASDKHGANEANNSLSLIKEEIAIMKKLNHNNLVSLIEVLDDPQEDSLYMVLEMCKKGVAMKVGLDERAEPYDDETCRCWFRDMILGIEYLHAQGIIHRDIKPDNCLITGDDVLKIVDFGVSEMFEKQSEMATAKSAGSPAFMPPELCVAKHGQVSGKAADIWSMGVTLYCLRYGHIPFEKGSMIELYDSIRGDGLPLEEEKDSSFADLITRVLEKDPEKRITMEEIRKHPWVTKNGTDELLSTEENCADLVEPPTEAEMDHAITGNMAHLLAVMKAVKRFKKALSDKRGQLMDGIFGRDSKLVAPPHSMRNQDQSQSQDGHDGYRRHMDRILVTAGIRKDVEVDDDMHTVLRDMEHLGLYQSPDAEDDGTGLDKALDETEAHYKQRLETTKHRPEAQSPEGHRTISERRSRTFPVDGHAKGHAHDPLEDTLFLDIGHDPDLPADPENLVVSESPSGVDMNIYEQAYQEEMERILARRPEEPSMYMTRRVEHREDIRALSNIKDAGKYAARRAAAKLEGWQNRSYSARQSAGDSAKAAAGRVSDKWHGGSYGGYFEAGKQAARSGGEYLEPWKQSAKGAASSAREKLGAFYQRSGGTGEGWSSWVGRGQPKNASDGSDPVMQDGENPSVDGQADQPQAKEGGATDGASEKPGTLFNKGGGTGGGLSSLVEKAQAKNREEAAETNPKDSEQPPPADQPQSADGTNAKTESTSQPQDTTQEATASSTEDQGPATPCIPGGFPMTPQERPASSADRPVTSKFKEGLS